MSEPDAPFLTPEPEPPAHRAGARLARWLAEHERLRMLPYPAQPDGREDTDAFGRRVAEMDRLLLAVAREPCAGPLDVLAKLTLVCHRLRLEADPDDLDRTITSLLAEGARDGVVRALLTEGAAPGTAPPLPAPRA